MIESTTKYPSLGNQITRNVTVHKKMSAPTKHKVKVTQLFPKLITLFTNDFQNINLTHCLNNYHLGKCFPSEKCSNPPGSNSVHKKCGPGILPTKNGNMGLTNLQNFPPEIPQPIRMRPLATSAQGWMTRQLAVTSSRGVARADQGSVKALCQYRLAMGSIKEATR